jgi:type II secretory pathway pseudopilin PulG
MAVVTIIGLFLALAGPSLGSVVSERKSAGFAREVVGMFQTARSRAAGTGAAHAVEYDAATSSFTVYSAVDGGGMPVSNCWSPDWTPGGANLRLIAKTVPTDAAFATTPLTVAAIPGTTPPIQYCFTPGGRFYSRTAAGNPWVSGVPAVVGGNGFTIALTAKGAAATLYQVIIGANGLPNLVVQ